MSTEPPAERREFTGNYGAVRVGQSVRHYDIGPCVLTELVSLQEGFMTAILNDGEWEVDARYLRPA